MSDANRTFNIEHVGEKFTISRGLTDQIVVTSEELVREVAGLSEDFWSKVQEEKLAQKAEHYEKFKPAGFEYAPVSFHKKREEYTSTGNLEKLQWIYDNVSYNADGTMNIIKLKMTFCEDVSGQNKGFTWEQVQELEKTNAGGYKLMSDYNKCDSDEVKQENGWYKVINIFSDGKGDTVEGMKLFRDMAGCNDRYWTGTPYPYKDENGTEVNGVALSRTLHKDICSRLRCFTYFDLRVCGFKNME